MYRFRSTPLVKMRQTQPFGVDYIGGGFYIKLGLKGHNGWDLSAATGTDVLAVADGIVEGFSDGGYGVNARLTTFVDIETKLEIVYGHLKEVLLEGEVKAGQVIASSNNTGLSTAPHLHLGVRVWKKVNGEWRIADYNNGFFGYVDPAHFYAADVFDLPVDKKYGVKKPFATELQFYASNVWFFVTFRRLMTTREYNAFVWGAWDVRTVLDPAMFPIWSEFTKPEALQRGLLK